jgi:hypothetical protein
MARRRGAASPPVRGWQRDAATSALVVSRPLAPGGGVLLLNGCVFSCDTVPAPGYMRGFLVKQSRCMPAGELE